MSSGGWLTTRVRKPDGSSLKLGAVPQFAHYNDLHSRRRLWAQQQGSASRLRETRLMKIPSLEDYEKKPEGAVIPLAKAS